MPRAYASRLGATTPGSSKSVEERVDREKKGKREKEEKEEKREKEKREKERGEEKQERKRKRNFRRGVWISGLKPEFIVFFSFSKKV